MRGLAKIELELLVGAGAVHAQPRAARVRGQIGATCETIGDSRRAGRQRRRSNSPREIRAAHARLEEFIVP